MSSHFEISTLPPLWFYFSCIVFLASGLVKLVAFIAFTLLTSRTEASATILMKAFRSVWSVGMEMSTVILQMTQQPLQRFLVMWAGMRKVVNVRWCHWYSRDKQDILIDWVPRLDCLQILFDFRLLFVASFSCSKTFCRVRTFRGSSFLYLLHQH